MIRIGYKLQKYRFGFDLWGIILFFLVMVPNFLWFAVPAPHDVLRIASKTPTLDGIASVFQIIMVVALCFVVRKEKSRPIGKTYLILTLVALMSYYAGWILYYTGVTCHPIILDLCAAPCVAFSIFSYARQNIPALISSLLFTVCHVLYGIINF